MGFLPATISENFHGASTRNQLLSLKKGDGAVDGNMASGLAGEGVRWEDGDGSSPRPPLTPAYRRYGISADVCSDAREGGRESVVYWYSGLSRSEGTNAPKSYSKS